MSGSSIQQLAEETGNRAEVASRARSCFACGAEARRPDARFCFLCGCRLSGDYLPADALRASYHLTGSHALVSSKIASPSAYPAWISASLPRSAPKNSNGPALTALAFASYALVPYLGIFFCAPAIALGGFGLARWRRAPQVGGRNASILAIGLGFLILCIQLFLWWIIYKIPQWTQL